jgi:hypothetical protein
MMFRFIFAAFACFCGSGFAQKGDQRPSMSDWKEAKEEVAEEAAAVKAKESKMSAVNKVIDLLEGLKAKVLSEGEEEVATYNKFACFCKDGTAEKTKNIQEGTDKKADLGAFIETETAARANHDSEIARLEQEIADSEKAQKIATDTRKGENDVYNKNADDLTAAIDALKGAIASMKTSKSPSFEQISAVKETVRTAVILADALGLQTDPAPWAGSFLQANPEVEMENYKFHSDGIIATLEKLHTDFKSEKAEVDATEVSAVQAHTAFMQEQTDLVKRKNSELKDNQEGKAAKHASIAGASEDLSTTSATLLDDQEYLKELSEICSKKAQTWDARSQVRQDELSALTAAIGVIKEGVVVNTTAATMRFAQTGVSVRMAAGLVRNPAWMEAAEAEAEAAEATEPLAFFQQRAFLAPTKAITDGGRRAVADLLLTSGQKLKSTLLTSLANQVSADPLGKVKILIQELIERLLQEAANDSNQKDWCDKATKDAEQKREYAEKAVDKHNADMALHEATRDTLNEEIAKLAEEINNTMMIQAEAEADRKAENAENTQTVQDATAGLAAVEQAIDILTKFYKTAAKSKVVYSIAQIGKGPAADEAPDAGFKNDEAYISKQGDAVGIIGMMEVIKGDFTRTITETEKAEEEARLDHLKFMTESTKSLKQKNVAKDEKDKYLMNTLDELETSSDGLNAEMEILTTAVKELMELKPVCVDTGMSYADRKARRKDEMESLKKALCILEAYAEYGPDGLADAC